MNALRGPVYLSGREYYEVMEPWSQLTEAIENYLEEITEDVKPGEEMFLPPFDQWEVPENDLLGEEVEHIAGEAGYHIEQNSGDHGFTYYAS